MSGLSNKLLNMKVKKKLHVLTGFMTAGIVISGLLGIIALWLLNNKTNEIADGWMPSATMAEQMNVLTSDYRIAQYGYLTAKDEAQMKMFQQRTEELAEQIASISAKYEAQAMEQEDLDLLYDVRELWNSYKTESAKVMQLSLEGSQAEAEELMVGSVRLIYEQFTDSFNKLVSFNETGSDKAANNAYLTFLFVMIIIILCVIITLILSAIISKMVTNSIAEPLKQVRQVLGKISEGTLNVEMDYTSKDEFGELSEEVNHFAGSLKTIISDENYLLLEMANGNFNIKTTAESSYIGDYAQILKSLRAIHRKLGSAMEKIAESSMQVMSASEQMAQEAQSLANGAAEQAGTVEQLVATVEEAADQAVSSAKQAEEASQTATNVKGRAEQSNQRMDEMIEAMDKINHTSAQISTIIQTIEDIASQTNMLSLNASIEAARAGDAGRGFAVVADEIGKLALQCSQAAGNTKKLIETAIAQAKNGDKIAKETATELHSVTEGVAKIVSVADGVREVCVSQADSMKQINEGIEIISKVVEDNSAAAQESSAASEELAAHAENLQTQMSAFKFRD